MIDCILRAIGFAAGHPLPRVLIAVAMIFCIALGDGLSSGKDLSSMAEDSKFSALSEEEQKEYFQLFKLFTVLFFHFF